MSRNGIIDNTVTLRSSKGHGKLVARLVSEGAPMDPSFIAWWEKVLLLIRWWWVGFATFPRIVKEAGVLFFKRLLHVWYRPEPLKESIGRRADWTEHQLELTFRKYLRHLVEDCDAAIAVKYIPSGISDNGPELMLSRGARDSSSNPEEMEFKVLTPVFYSRFVCYAHDLEALFCEFRESCTIWISSPDLLPKLLFKKPSPPLNTTNYMDFAYFKAIQYLRRRPDRIERPLTSSQAPSARPASEDIRGLRISAMDAFVLSEESRESRKAYRGTVLKLFIADRTFLGMVPVLDAQRLLIQGIMAWIISSGVSLIMPLLVNT
jgi:hypothetical protein